MPDRRCEHDIAHAYFGDVQARTCIVSHAKHIHVCASHESVYRDGLPTTVFRPIGACREVNFQPYGRSTR